MGIGVSCTPWGAEISPAITDLSNYFVTSTGNDLIASMRELFEDMIEFGDDMEIVDSPASSSWAPRAERDQ